MAVYARPSWQLARQVTSDVFMLVWTLGWAVVGRLLHRLVGQLAAPADQTADTARQLVGKLNEAASAAAKAPVVGDQLRAPFDGMAQEVGALAASAGEQAAAIHRLALVLGWVVFLVPVLTLLAVWLPRRIRFVTSSRAARTLITSAADLDLFALRALANQPMHVLARISGDPVSAWRSGDRVIINQLADLELRRAGLVAPAFTNAEVGAINTAPQPSTTAPEKNHPTLRSKTKL